MKATAMLANMKRDPEITLLFSFMIFIYFTIKYFWFVIRQVFKIYRLTRKCKTALFAINLGADLEDVSEYLNWKDFESLTGIILEEKDFEVTKNLILTKPRMEIDVIGKKMDIALLIDCKHWKNMSKSALDEIVKKQVERVKHFVSIENMSALPVIVTLHQETIQFIGNVPIVPIMKLSSFLDEFVGNLDSLKSIEK